MVILCRYRLGLCVLAALCLAGCAASQQDLAWQVAKDSNAPSDYANYLRQYPSGAHAEEARWEAARRADTVSAYLAYLQANPQTPRRNEIDERLTAVSQKEMSVSDSYAYLAYCRTYMKKPSKKNLSPQDTIRRRLEEQEWKAAKESGGLMPLVFFLRKYPASAHASDAQAVVLEKRFEAARKMDQPFAYQAFLQFYPSGPRAEEIRARLEPGKGSSASPDGGEFDPRTAFKEVAAKDPVLEQMGCSLILADRIRKGGTTAEIDEWREKLNVLEERQGPIPAECAGLEHLTLAARDKAAAARAVRVYLHGREDLSELAEHEKTMGERAELLKRSVKAADGLSQQLETDELAEGVLGGGALGGMDLGLAEKGSVTAERAKERLDVLEAAAARNAAAADTLLRSQGGQAEAVRFYLTSLLKLES